jgi:hypothetical protein
MKASTELSILQYKQQWSALYMKEPVKDTGLFGSKINGQRPRSSIGEQ